MSHNLISLYFFEGSGFYVPDCTNGNQCVPLDHSYLPKNRIVNADYTSGDHEMAIIAWDTLELDEIIRQVAGSGWGLIYNLQCIICSIINIGKIKMGAGKKYSKVHLYNILLS